MRYPTWLRKEFSSKQQVEDRLKALESPTPYRDDYRSNLKTWEEYEAAAKATSQIEYGCDFVDGVCLSYRTNSSTDKLGKALACCRSCKVSVGYFYAIPPNTAKWYARRFSLYTGFWRRGKGCILPREKRSSICLRYFCYSYIPGVNAKEKYTQVTSQLNQLFQIKPLKRIKT